MILLSKTEHTGSVYFDIKTNTLYFLPFSSPSEEYLCPPFFMLVIILDICIFILGENTSFFAFLLSNLVAIICIRLLVLNSKRANRKKILLNVEAKKQMLPELSDEEVRILKKMSSRMLVNQYYWTNRFQYIALFLGICSFCFAFFRPNEKYTCIMMGVILSEFFLYYVDATNQVKKMKIKRLIENL